MVMKPAPRREFLSKSLKGVLAFSIVPRVVLGGEGYVSPSDRITLGIIGTGKQSAGLASRFVENKEVSLIAACDVFKEKLQWFKAFIDKKQKGSRSLKGIDTYEEYEKIVARKDIDGVIVTTPDHWHAKIAISAVKMGKDVYCEKPLTHTIQEGKDLVKAVREEKRILQTGSMQRSRKNFRHACELVRNGYLGDIKKVIVSVGDPAIPNDLTKEELPTGLNWEKWCGPSVLSPYNAILAPPYREDMPWPMWRKYQEYGGGILADWGAHMFDIAQWGLGMDHSGPSILLPPNDETAVRGLKMVYDNGVEMIHEDFGRGHAVRFIGTEGSLDVSRGFLDSNPTSIAKAKIGEGAKRLYRSDDHVADWIQAIKKREDPVCNVETGHRSASVCNLANIAYKLHRPLKWDPVKEKFMDDGEADELQAYQYRKPY